MKIVQPFILAALYLALLAKAEKEEEASSKLNLRRALQAPAGHPLATEVPSVGGVTTTTAIVGFRTAEAAEVHILYSDNKNFRNLIISDLVTTHVDDDFTGSIELPSLQPATMYWYKLFVHGNGEQDFGTVQKFETMPEPGATFRFSIFADSAPYYNGRAAPVYQAGSSNPNEDGSLFAMQIGDFDHSDAHNLAELRLMHRGLRDIDSNSGFDFAKNIMTKMAFVHIWDDHDYCGNDSDGTCAHKIDVLKAYDEYYPGYARPNPEDGIYHKFLAGDAEIFMLDTRFQRTPDTAPDTADKTMLGATQKQWLKNSLATSTAAWKIIVSTVSANKHSRPGNIDHWGSFVTEANELKDFLAADPNLADSTVMVTGDLHSGGGIDGGCNGRFGIPELGVAHTNLRKGNTAAVGYWTEGVRDGSHSGYGSILVSPTTLTLESKGATGNAAHHFTLPGPYNTDGCVSGGGAGLKQCSTNFATFQMPTSGDCGIVTQGETYTAPFENADADTPIENKVTWYDCPSSDLIFMQSNDIPEHTVTIGNPNKPCEQNILAQFPRTPLVGTGMTETDNVLGFALNGVVAFSPLEAGNNNAVEPLPGATLLDAQHWWGHPTAQHVWHYHSPFLGKDDSAVVLSPSTLLGVAMDGFPIFGPIADPDNVLDKCNFDSVNQRYHIRTKEQVDETLDYCNVGDDAEHVNWKYIIGCYSGDLNRSAIHDSLVQELPADCVPVADVTSLF